MQTKTGNWCSQGFLYNAFKTFNFPCRSSPRKHFGKRRWHAHFVWLWNDWSNKWCNSTYWFKKLSTHSFARSFCLFVRFMFCIFFQHIPFGFHEIAYPRLAKKKEQPWTIVHSEIHNFCIKSAIFSSNFRWTNPEFDRYVQKYPKSLNMHKNAKPSEIWSKIRTCCDYPFRPDE